MTDFRKLAFVGLMGLGLVSVGCGSKTSDTGTGGSNGSGGSSSTGGSTAKGGSNGSGGSSASGGSNGSGGSSSTGGAAGGTAAVGCAMSDAPASADIATFSSADGGISAMYGTYTYGSTPAPTFTVATGMVTVTDIVQIAGGPHYNGFGLYMNGNADGTDCVNASTYTGVQFDLSGSLTGTGCAMVFSINDSEHADMTNGTPPDPKAGGPKGSYAPQLAISSSQLTTAVQTIKVPFTGTGSPSFANGAASPATAIDPMKLTGIQWQLATPTPSTGDGAATECDWTINLANIKFY